MRHMFQEKKFRKNIVFEVNIKKQKINHYWNVADMITHNQVLTE